MRAVDCLEREPSFFFYTAAVALPRRFAPPPFNFVFSLLISCLLISMFPQTNDISSPPGAGVIKCPGSYCPWKGARSTAMARRMADAAEVRFVAAEPSESCFATTVVAVRAMFLLLSCEVFQWEEVGNFAIDTFPFRLGSHDFECWGGRHLTWFSNHKPTAEVKKCSVSAYLVCCYIHSKPWHFERNCFGKRWGGWKSRTAVGYRYLVSGDQ